MKHVIQSKIQAAIDDLISQHVWADFNVPQFDVHYPQHRDHGDYASNVAMVLAKLLKRAPMEIGEDIKAHLNLDGLDRIEIIQPGFLNFFINEEFLTGGVNLILKESQQYGHNTIGTGKNYLVEFISANPTGPIHLGNGRGGFTGDTIVRVLRASGYTVTAEFYVNDFGNQADTLAESVLRRYLQEQGIKIDYPENLYQGEYIKDLAKKIDLKDVPLGNQHAMQEIREEIKQWSMNEMLEQIKNLVSTKLDIQYDVWKSEGSLHTEANLQRANDFLENNNLIYEKDGAKFFPTSRYGDEKDRVMIKSDGNPTYFLSDILYLIDKFEDRKIDHWVWILGADHHGYKPRMEAALEAMNHKSQMDIIFVQLVRLMFNGKELKMSKRKGTFITLEELVDEIGIDVARWFFLMHEPNTHMDFDLNLAREQSDKNPVYYVQYAHARISSLLKKIPNDSNVPVTFTSQAEEDLAKILFRLPELVEDVSNTYQVHKLPQYALEVARAFHKFYTSNRVIDNDEVNYSRVQLVKATQIVLQNTLALMGISAPEKM